jgi:5-methylcytosine-specific restriction endonuclease McrA
MNYGSKQWKKKRNKILRRDKYKDKIKARFGITEDATIVHHIYPSDEYPEYAWEDWNLISVSNSTHRELHKKDGSLTQKGIELMQRTIPEEKK